MFLAESSPFGNMLLPIGLILIFLFIVIIPSRKEAKKRQSMQKELKRGDRVLTQAGIIARVAQAN